MGQALRRASGRVRTAGSSMPSERTPSGSTMTSEIETITRSAAPRNNGPLSNPDAVGPESAPKVNMDNVLEERNHQYDAMLSQMVGRIREKPMEKLEMGEGSMVGRSTRPMPKLRNTKPDSGNYDDRPTPPGTLKVAQLRQIMQLLKAKETDHNEPMDVRQISEQFQLDESQVKNILESISLPRENRNKNKGPV